MSKRSTGAGTFIAIGGITAGAGAMADLDGGLGFVRIAVIGMTVRIAVIGMIVRFSVSGDLDPLDGEATRMVDRVT